MILPIYLYGQPVLKKVAEDINADYPNLSELIQNMFDTMHHAQGIGLAAPQIGELKRAILVRSDDKFIPFINPVIIKKSGRTYTAEEGCLSLDGRRAVKRYESVMVTFTDIKGKRTTKTFNGSIAEIIQHEVDHLNGLVFIDRLSEDVHKTVAGELENLARRGKKFNFKREVKLWKPAFSGLYTVPAAA